VWCGATSSSEGHQRAGNSSRPQKQEKRRLRTAGGACGRSMREEHVGGACGRGMREEHAGERSGSLSRTDAAQIRGNLALVVGGGPLERRPSPTRTRELKRLKYNKPCAPIFKRACRGGFVPVDFCVHVSFRLHEKSTKLDVTSLGRPMERRPSTTRTRELKRLKYNKPCAPIFKRACRVGFVPVDCVHVSFRLHEKSTNLNVTFCGIRMERRVSTTRTRELKRLKYNKPCGGRTSCFLRSRQLSPPREIDKSRCTLFRKTNGAQSFHYENKRVKTSEI
jgi:hypothetical protein